MLVGILNQTPKETNLGVSPAFFFNTTYNSEWILKNTLTTIFSGVNRSEKHCLIYIPKRDLLTPTFWNRSLRVVFPTTRPTRVRQTGKHVSILIVSDLFELMIEKLTKWKSAVFLINKKILKQCKKVLFFKLEHKCDRCYVHYLFTTVSKIWQYLLTYHFFIQKSNT